jgi:hypothetical protein
MSVVPKFAEKTTEFVRDGGNEYYYRGDDPIPEYDLENYREQGREYTYDPRIRRKCPNSGCSMPASSNVPTITPDSFKVERVDSVNSDNPCSKFCTYPKDTFAYEMPPNACFRSCGNYPTYASYFPGNFRKNWRIDPVTGDVTYLPTDRGLCDSQFKTPRYPAWRYSSPSPFNPQVLNFTTPITQNTINSQIVRASTSGRRDISNSSAVVSNAISNAPIIIPTNLGSVSDIVPGEQDIMSHRFVQDNRYNAQKIKENIFIRPRDDVHIEPYNPSLYQTPYDETKNMISTGKLVNTYLGETFETFENQPPPPNLNRPLMKSQLKQPNPRLIHMNGGYNHHNPPPRKCEQPGYIFNPVSVRGGPSPFGSNPYDPQVTQQMKMYASRDIYNNKDGDLVVEPSMYGDKPQGMFGLVPRTRYQPFLPATQELDVRGRTNVPQDLNPDTRKREEYTGEFFARKAKLLVSRAVAPNSLINGVMAVAQIPIASDQVGRFGQCQSYITPAFVDGASYVHHAETRPGRIAAGQTTRINHANDTKSQPPLQPIDLNIKGKLSSGQSNRLAGNPELADTGGVITTEATVRNTLKTGMVDQVLRVGDPSAPLGGVLVSQASVRDTQKQGMVDQPHRSGDPNLAFTGGVLVSQATVRNTLKTGMVDVPHPAILEGRGDLGQSVAVLDHKLRPTLKTTMVDQAFNHVVMTNPELQTMEAPSALQTLRPTQKTSMVDVAFRVGDPNLSYTGGVLTSQANVRPTQKFDQEIFPVGAITPIAKAGVIVSEHNIRETLKTNAVDVPFRVGDPNAPDVGGILTSQANIRESLKDGVVDQPFRVGDPHAQNSAGVLTSQATVRPTLRIHAEDSFPSASVRVTGEPGYVQLDRTLPCTERMTTGVLSHQPGPNGQNFGDLLPLQNLTTKQVRGTMIQQYITQNSQVYDGIGGSSDRVISAMQQLRPKTNTYFYGNPGQGILQPNNIKMIPSMRLTQRAVNDMKDLMSAQEHDDC